MLEPLDKVVLVGYERQFLYLAAGALGGLVKMVDNKRPHKTELQAIRHLAQATEFALAWPKGIAPHSLRRTIYLMVDLFWIKGSEGPLPTVFFDSWQGTANDLVRVFKGTNEDLRRDTHLLCSAMAFCGALCGITAHPGRYSP